MYIFSPRIEAAVERGQGDADSEKASRTEGERTKAYFVGGKLEYCICRKPDINRFMIGKRRECLEI